jgi:IS30 family transposase
MARFLHRSPITISRILRCTADTSGYAICQVQKRCQHRRQIGRPQARLHVVISLFGLVHHFLLARCLPEQFSLKLALIYPKGHKSRVSYDTVYNCIFDCLLKRCAGILSPTFVKPATNEHPVARAKTAGPDFRQVCPPEIEGRLLPGHWEGDIFKGKANVVGMLVELTSRRLMLIKLPRLKAASAANVLEAFTDKLLGISQPMKLIVTYDQCRMMAMHKKLTQQTGMAVYFCDPHSTGQRGSNENTNGLISQYLQRLRICLSTAKINSMRLPMKSMADPEKASVYDHRWRSTESYSSTTRSIQPSFINYTGVELHFSIR